MVAVILTTPASTDIQANQVTQPNSSPNPSVTEIQTTGFRRGLTLHPGDESSVARRSEEMGPVVLRASNGPYGRHFRQRSRLSQSSNDDDQATP